MAITNRGTDVAASGTTAATATWLAGAVGDVIIASVGHKPYSSTATAPDGTWTELATITSGSVANGAGTGSTRAAAWVKTATDAGTGSATFSVTSGSPTVGRCTRIGATSGVMATLAVGLADTDESLLSVSATGSVAAGGIASGDYLVIQVMIKDDALAHTSQALAVAGCTLGAITWASKAAPTAGNDGAQYVGVCSVTAGSSTGSVTYTATSNTAGSSAAAVTVARVRELTAPTAFAATDNLTTGVDTSWTQPSSGAPTSYTVKRQYAIPALNGTFDSSITGWANVGGEGTLAWEAADQALRMTATGGAIRALSPAFAVTPGQFFRVSADIKRVAGTDRQVGVGVEYYDSGGAMVSGWSFGVITSTASYQSTGGSLSGAVPAGAVTAKAYARAISTVAADAFVVDNVVVTTDEVTFTGIAGTSYSDTTAVAGVTYIYFATAVTSGSESPASNTDTGTRLSGTSTSPRPVLLVTRQARIRSNLY